MSSRIDRHIMATIEHHVVDGEVHIEVMMVRTVALVL